MDVINIGLDQNLFLEGETAQKKNWCNNFYTHFLQNNAHVHTSKSMTMIRGVGGQLFSYSKGQKEIEQTILESPESNYIENNVSPTFLDLKYQLAALEETKSFKNYH